MSNFVRTTVSVIGGTITFTGSIYAGYVISKGSSNPRDVHNSSNSMELPDKATRLRTYNSLASSYDDKIGWDETVMGLPLLRRWLISNAKGSVLEVAVGTGRNLAYYQTRSQTAPVSSVTVTDTSQNMLAVAQARATTTMAPGTKPLELIMSEAETLTCHPALSGRRFDTVIDTFGLCSFEDPVQALVQMQRCCEPGGKILLLEHGRSDKWQWISRLLDTNAAQHAMKWGCIWNRDIKQIVASSGLEVESMETYHFGTTYRIIGRPGRDCNRWPITASHENNQQHRQQGTKSVTALSPIRKNEKRPRDSRVCSCHACCSKYK